MTASAAATSARQRSRSRQVGVEGEAAEVGVGQVAVRAGVPGHVALEEGDRRGRARRRRASSAR